MSIAVVTGSAGLIGSEATKYFSTLGWQVVGIDNNLRKYFFGEEGSTDWNIELLKNNFKNYRHYDFDIRDKESIENIFQSYGPNIKLVIHTAAQPSHDWAVKEPMTDFTVNANGTLVLLEATRKFAPEAVFIFTSTNKVYGDLPNGLPLIENEKRYEIEPGHKFYPGIDETMSVDQCLHSLFGVSKVAADLMVQEYGKYFGMKTVAFRGGCLTGPAHSGAQLHGFLSYIMKCAMTRKKYTIFGYQGKQVRDNIHSYDLVTAFHHFYQSPRSGEVYNIGGSRFSNCSVLEAIELCENITGNQMKIDYLAQNRIGDHIWWISNVSKFKAHYPTWNFKFNVRAILQEIYELNKNRWKV